MLPIPFSARNMRGIIGGLALVVVAATEAQTYRASYQDPHLGQGEVTLAVRESKIIWITFESTTRHRHVTMAPAGSSLKIIASQTLAARSGQPPSTPATPSHQCDAREPDKAAQMALLYGIPDWPAFYESLAAYFRARPAEFRDLVVTSRTRPTPKQPTSKLETPVILKL